MQRGDVPKGIHKVRKRLATGRVAAYYYAWRGGPRLDGEPGSPEFYASYAVALRRRFEPDADRFHSIVAAYRRSPEFIGRSPRTQSDYTIHLNALDLAFGDMPIAALRDARVTKDFLDWRDELAHSARQADYRWQVLMRLLSWARGRGITTYRPPERVRRLYHPDRSERIWLPEDIAAFVSKAPLSLRRAMLLALDTGLRQGDLLRLAWGAYDGAWIKLRQAKTGRRVAIPVTQDLRAMLEGMKRVSTMILTSERGRRWTANGFRSAWRKATRAAGVDGLTFHDLRGTTVTRLAEAECTDAQIAAITGHSLRDVNAILDRYLARTKGLALAAIAKLERARP